MKNALLSLEEFYDINIIKEKIVEIALDISKSRINAANALGKETQIAEEEYEEGSKLIKQGKYESGFDNIQKAFTRSDMLIKGQSFKDLKAVETEKNKEVDPFLYVLIFILIFAILVLILKLRLDS
jgi:recombinational DNA repair ATPase RecF